MAAKHLKQSKSPAASRSSGAGSRQDTSLQEPFLKRALVHVTGAMCLWVSICFFTATYDTAQVKLTLLHIGAVLLFSLWAALKISQKKNPFTLSNLPFLLPTFIYIGWNILCFGLAPYKLESTEEFIRLLMYGGITLLAATEFTLTNIRTITQYILTAAWISFSYAMLQVANTFWEGVDPMPWHSFFGKRIFSTHANPNFFGDFTVFASCLAAAQYFLTRKKSLLVLLGMGLISCFFTESKGAWVAYGVTVALGAFLYTNRLRAGSLHNLLKKINLAAAGLLVAALLAAGYYASKRIDSLGFRAHTWLSTLEMVQDSPVFGTGPGSFKIIYPAYRRPQIFYIENSHNTETQHAENELLEQAATTGVPGLAIFLWWVLFSLLLAVRQMDKQAASLQGKQRNAYLLGYTCAVAGIFMHSWVDISLRFASTGLFFALFLGILLALSQQKDSSEPISVSTVPPSLFLQGARLLLTTGAFYVAGSIFWQFKEVVSALALAQLGEVLLVIAAWGVLASCVVGGAYVLIRGAFSTRSVWAVVVMGAALIPIYYFYGFFQANHYYSLGVALTVRNNAEGALGYFTKAIEKNPLQTEYVQYRANVLASTLNLTKTHSNARGDKEGRFNDYERALRDYQTVSKRVPNHALLAQNQGQLFFKMALHSSQEAGQAKSLAAYQLFREHSIQHMQAAKESFSRALKLDPVNVSTYLYLIQISLMERDFKTAQSWIDAYRKGPDGVTEERFLQKHRNHPQIEAAQAQLRRIQSSVEPNR